MNCMHWKQVRDAGEDAWLGREAPEDPDLDGPEDPLLALPSSSGSGGALSTHPNDSKEVSERASTEPAAGAVGFGAETPCSAVEVVHATRQCLVYVSAAGLSPSVFPNIDPWVLVTCSEEGPQLSVTACSSGGSKGW